MWLRFLNLALWLGVWTSTVLGDAPQRSESKGESAIVELCDWNGYDVELLRDLSDGQLDQQSLLRAALTVGGNSPQEAAESIANFNAFTQGLRAKHENPPTVTQALIRHLFSQLQRNHLHGQYDPDLCDVGKTVSHGDFNCLTATILFRALCQEFAIDVVAIWEPSHVRCWVPLDNGRFGYVVETTAKSSQTAVTARLPRHQLAERVLTKEQLLGKVYYNRGVQQLRREAFPDALTSTWTSCVLDHDDQPAQNNLRACLNNWALAVSQHGGDIAFAIRLLDAGLQLDPTYEPFSRNLRLLRDH